MIFAQAPTRIDLAGGTIDLWPLYLFLESGITINAAISLYATAQIDLLGGAGVEIVSIDQNRSVKAQRMRQLENTELPLLCRLAKFFAPDRGFRLTTEARVPAGSGLGGSSTLAIAVCGALNEFTGNRFSKEEMIGIARDIEAQVLVIPTGEQDYYAAMYGGLSAWHFEVNRVRRETYDIPLSDLRDRFVLIYSGLPRSSGINNWQVFKQFVDDNPGTRKFLWGIHQAARDLHDALGKKDWSAASEAIGAEWNARKQLAPMITTPDIDEILDFGMKNGCMAGKVCGAGGGGCLFLMMEPEAKPRIRAAAEARSLRILDFEFVAEGLTVTGS